MGSILLKFKHFISSFLILSIALVVSSTQAQVKAMTPKEVYTRCYLQLTGLIPPKDSRMNSVTSGALSPAQACRQIFNLAHMGTNGVMTRRTDKVAQRVMERIHNIHMNWSTEKTPNAPLHTVMVNDFEEAALFFTRAALRPDQKFSSVVTLNSGLKGYRRPVNGTALPNMERKRIFNTPRNFDSDVPDNKFRLVFRRWDSNRVTYDRTPTSRDLSESYLTHFGKLQGVIAQPLINVPKFFNVAAFVRLPLVRTELKENSDTILNQHFGGGILGSQNFIQANTNLSVHQMPEGEELIHRRLAARIYEDLLCHQLPTLKTSDVSSDVNARSKYTFRHSTSCMQCHTSIDPLAFSYRNLMLTRSASASFRTEGYITETVIKVPQLNDSRYFATLTPRGSYAYRTLLDKKLIKGNVSTLAQLGSHIASTDDFYLCAAKKYYKYFTGVDVQMVDREPTGSQESTHQNMVIKLGQNLKQKQSVGEMLQILFNSSIYQSRDFLGAEVSK